MMPADIIKLALKEDLGDVGDITSNYFIPPNSFSRAAIIARTTGVLSGVAVAREVFFAVDRSITVIEEKNDSDAVFAGEKILSIYGPTRSILAAERVALNFLQHLSGISTLTAKFVSLAKTGGARIVDTRKTLPGLRALEKLAVTHGGGHNHRMGLYDSILVKDNHLAAIGKNPSVLRSVIKKIREEQKNILIEIEADSIQDAENFADIGVDIILLDNMAVEELREAIRVISKRARTEASGGVTLENVAEISQTGVDDISIGALTHSAPALDVALDFV